MLSASLNKTFPSFPLQIECHDDDVNAVSFADDSSQILFSGGDDGLVKVLLYKLPGC